MPSLTTASQATLARLNERSRECCVVYADHPMPPGTTPATGEIGVEQTQSTTTLYVRRGYRYDGADESVAEWLNSGTRSFASFGACIAWLVLVVTGQSPAAGQQARPQGAPVRRPVAEVTELDRIEIADQPAPTADSLEVALAAHVLGQPVAIRGLAELAGQHLAKPHPRRPASALLVGATGTGKTLAAEQLALSLTESSGAEWSYQRLDMSEFSEQHSVSRLFGAPPGYVGYSDGHDLATALRANPRSVILFDEIDKAHPQLWRSLMNLMDAGRLGGQAGDIDAREAILLFTSNKDAATIQSIAESDDRQRAFLREHGYPPEIVARMGRILVFRPLSAQIRIELVVLTVQRVIESFGLSLGHIAPSAVADLAARAPMSSGARDVEYFVERELAQQLAAHAGSAQVVRIEAGGEVTAVAPAS